MIIALLQAVSISLLSFVLWKFIRPFVVKSPLANIAGPPKTSWWKGNFHQIFDYKGWKFHHDIVEKYGSVVKLYALFGDEQLYISDPRAIHHIVVKDQYVYEESSMFISTNTLVFGKGLLATLGDHHRKQRKLLNPVFSLNHMRALLPIFYPVAHQLKDVVKQEMLRNDGEVNLLEWMSRAALELVGQGTMGYSFSALTETKPNEYSRATSELGPTMFRLTLWRQFLPHLIKIGSTSFWKKILDWTPFPLLQKMKNMVEIMNATSREVYMEKKDAYVNSGFIPEQVQDGKDLMSVLLRANHDADQNDRLPEEEIIAQMNTFIFAGHSTTTNGICRIVHQLADHPEVQTRLREEVTRARREHGDLSYEDLMALPYLDAVCRETLRVFPPVPFVVRTTRKDIVLPLLWPIKSADGKSDISEIPLKNNTNVFVSIIAANRSKAIWGDDAEEWKPERWLKPMPESVSNAHLPGVYASMMTFLGGGRACIGFKFAEMEIKVMLSILLEAYEFSLSRDIYWNMSGLQFPALQDDPQSRPQFPINIRSVQLSQRTD